MKLKKITGSRPSAYRDGFEYPASQRRKTRRQITITGTRDAGSRIKGAPEPSRYIFVHRLQNGTSEENIKLYLSDNDIEAKGVTKVSNIEAKYASFKVEVKMSSMDTLLAADFWPTGVCVRRFYQSRNTQP